MIYKKIWIMGLLLQISLSANLSAQSIADKKASLTSLGSDLDRESDDFLFQVNKETEEIQEEIKLLYEEVDQLYTSDANIEAYEELLEKINERKSYLFNLKEKWREMACRNNRTEGYGLWHAPETNLEQLIIDYGSQDYVYLIPPEVGAIKLSVDSNLPIPRASWSEMLELILTQNGVGYKNLNPYLRQLFLIKQNQLSLTLITNSRKDLELLPSESRISFVLSPEPSELRRSYCFLEKFINSNTSTLQALGRDILLIGPSADIQALLKLYDFISTNRGDKEYRLIPVSRVRADEMARILEVMFDQSAQGMIEEQSAHEGNYRTPIEINGLRVIILGYNNEALFVVGTREEIRKAEEVVRNVENQIGGATERVVHWYTTKHSEPEELADVLYRVYSLMISTGTGNDVGPNSGSLVDVNVNSSDNGGGGDSPPSPSGNGDYIINPAPAEPGIILPTQANKNRDNFIVDLKTGSIVMVVEADVLPKLKELIRRLDVPKKMVQIETLLFERVLNRENSVGLNLLRIGDAASNCYGNGFSFNNIFPLNCKEPLAGNKGIFDFFINRTESSSGIPAFDLAYRFLLFQDDIHINSSPSVLTVNQTPATIAIQQDISINTGVFETDGGNYGGTLKNAFARAQYGITISIKPTIHLCSEDSECDEQDYVTLETDITFDTIQGGDKNRPDVIRRHVTSIVDVVNGESAVIGGLRSKTSTDTRDSIPFIGELPGIGKLFSINSIKDNTTEMFIFITPKIIKDPKDQLNCLRQELLCRRPGDVPYFLECLEEARRYEKERLFQGSLTLLLGQTPSNYYIPDEGVTETVCEGEYDGR